MKKPNLAISAFTVLWLVSAPALAAPLVFNLDFGQDGSFDNALTLNLNQRIWADVYVSSVSDPGLISMGFDLVYDTSRLQVLNAAVGGNWDLGSVDRTSPSVQATGGMFLGTQIGDNILLASIEFKSIGAGTSGLALLDSDHGGSYADFVLGDADGTVLDGDLAGGVLLSLVETPQAAPPLQPLPEPGTFLLLLPGLAGLAASKKTAFGDKRP